MNCFLRLAAIFERGRLLSKNTYNGLYRFFVDVFSQLLCLRSHVVNYFSFLSVCGFSLSDSDFFLSESFFSLASSTGG